MHHLAHSFTHSAVRGAGWGAGRDLERQLLHALGWPALVLVVVLALMMGRRR